MIHQSQIEQNKKRLLRLPEVLRLIPVCRASWYAGVHLGLYPKPLKIGKRTVAWLESDIEKVITEFKQVDD